MPHKKDVRLKWVNCVVCVCEMKKSLMRYLFSWVFFFLRTLVYLVSYGPHCEKTCLHGGGGWGGEGGGGVDKVFQTSLLSFRD